MFCDELAALFDTFQFLLDALLARALIEEETALVAAIKDALPLAGSGVLPEKIARPNSEAPGFGGFVINHRLPLRLFASGSSADVEFG
jgi:hypothetical protein